jgi:hypothetical protein
MSARSDQAWKLAGVLTERAGVTQGWQIRIG